MLLLLLMLLLIQLMLVLVLLRLPLLQLLLLLLLSANPTPSLCARLADMKAKIKAMCVPASRPRPIHAISMFICVRVAHLQCDCVAEAKS